jgi:hypothetical protein
MLEEAPFEVCVHTWLFNGRKDVLAAVFNLEEAP